jgi:hypothetical protein
MQKEFLEFKNQIIILLILMLFVSLPSNALVYNDLRNFMLAGDVDSVISQVEIKPKTASELDIESAELYLMSKIILGDIEEAHVLIDFYLAKYPKSSSLIDLKKQLLFFEARFQEAEKYKLDDYEKAQYKLMSLMDEYLIDLKLYRIKNPSLMSKVFLSDEELDSSLKAKRKKIIKLADSIDNNRPYFRAKLEYLLELKDPVTNKAIEKEALEIISKKRQLLFPKTMDFYELALAYKVLAIMSIQMQDEKSAKGFIKLGQKYIYNMRSIWLIEDIIVHKKIMKTTQHLSRFGYLVPQWLMYLREEFDSYLR